MLKQGCARQGCAPIITSFHPATTQVWQIQYLRPDDQALA